MVKRGTAYSLLVGQLIGAMQDCQPLFQTVRLQKIRGLLQLAEHSALPRLVNQ